MPVSSPLGAPMKKVRTPMITRSPRLSLPLTAGLLAAALLVGSSSAALAQETPPSPSDKLAVNLVRLLAKQGIITTQQADGLIAEAEQQTAAGRAQAPMATAAAMPPPAPGVLRVPYVPEVVKAQIREEIKAEVMAQARSENWAQPDALPGWINRIEWSGDLRLRSEFDVFDKSNTNEFLDFAAFNASGPTDINPDTNPNGLPFLNTRQNRDNLWVLRARLALAANLSDRVQAGVRIATGRDNGPVSTNNGLGGGFSKKDLWLDRAFVTLSPTPWGTITLGRMPNPFFSTDLVYDDDLNFDGAAAHVSGVLANVGVGLTAGAMPIDTSAGNFPSNATDKGQTQTKWLYALQATAAVERSGLRARTGAAYYRFENMRGQLSQPCALYNGNKQCSADPSRPASMQKGNTLFLLRDIQPNPATPLNFAQPQFVGLSMNYDLLDLTGEVSIDLGARHRVSLLADYVRNLAYDAKDVCRNAPKGLPVNNLTASAKGNLNPCTAPAGDQLAVLDSGGTGWQVRATVGATTLKDFGDWQLSAGYRYLEADAVVDAFTDSDFHLGGTNAQGYVVGGSLVLFRNVLLGGRWMSANEVSGAPLSIDVGQIDLNVRF